MRGTVVYTTDDMHGAAHVKDKNWRVLRGDLYLANLDPAKGSESAGSRIVLVVSSDEVNRTSQTVLVSPFHSSNKGIKEADSRVKLWKDITGTSHDGRLMMEQIRAIDRLRLNEFVCRVPASIMELVDEAIRYTFFANPID